MFCDLAEVLHWAVFFSLPVPFPVGKQHKAGTSILAAWDGVLNILHPAKESSARFKLCWSVRGEETNLFNSFLKGYPPQSFSWHVWVARALGKFVTVRFLQLCTHACWFLAIKSNGQHWITSKTSSTQNTNCNSVQYINNNIKKKSPQSFKTTRPSISSASSQALVYGYTN